MSRSRVGIALSGAAVLFACGGVAAAAAGSPLGPGIATGDPSVSLSSTPTPGSAPADDGVEEGEDGSTDAEGEEDGEDGDGQEAGDDSGEAAAGGVGPDAAGAAHHGLCTAWSHVMDAPGKAADSTAFRNLQAVGCDDVVTEPEPGEDDDDADIDTEQERASGQDKEKGKGTASGGTTKHDKASTAKGTKSAKSAKGKGKGGSSGRR